MTFQKTVLTVALVLFLILMVVIAAMMTSSKKTEIFPPEIGECPDYWEKTLSGGCKNVHNLGKNCESPVIFSENYDKKKFAKECRITWDGITNK